MAVTTLANLTYGELKKRASGEHVPNEPCQSAIYFNCEKQIIPFFDNHWENLTSLPRRSVDIAFCFVVLCLFKLSAFLSTRIC